MPRRPGSERWGHYKVARKTGEYAESMAIALIDKARGKARLVVGATDGAPLVLERSSREIAGGHAGASLAAVIRAGTRRQRPRLLAREAPSSLHNGPARRQNEVG